MENSLSASQQQYSIMLDFMETNGDLSRPQRGARRKLKAKRLWNELAELLNSVGGSAVQNQADKWKRVWSDWKTKTKKKTSGGGPDTVTPLNSLEERVLRIIGIGSFSGDVEVPEAGFELRLPLPARLHQNTHRSLGLSVEEAWRTEASTLPIPEIPHTAPVSSNLERPGDAQRSPSACKRPRHRRRSSIGQRRRLHLTPFQQATREFVRIEEGRLHLEEMHMTKEHERETARISIESQRNRILQKILDNIERFLTRDMK
ncbi:unnamed protein product, partial [Brenthis ino]